MFLDVETAKNIKLDGVLETHSNRGNRRGQVTESEDVCF